MKSSAKILKKTIFALIHSYVQLTEEAMKRRKIEIVLSVHHVLYSFQSAAITAWMNSDISASMEQKNRLISPVGLSLRH